MQGLFQKYDIEDILRENEDLNIDHKDYNINVTAQNGSFLKKEKLIEEMRFHEGEGKRTSLYFHVPLCDYICKFCNYVKTKIPSKKEKSEEVLDLWTKALIEESNRYLKKFPWIKKTKIESLYFGGGTAALLTIDQLGSLLDHVRKNYQLDPHCEISLEGNPDNFIDGKIQSAINLGFNRFSVGIQSLQDEVLSFTGRNHTVAMSLESIRELKKTGLPFNIDYMFGLPFQTPEKVEKDMEVLLKEEVPTITIYRLRNADRQSMGIGNKSAWNNEKLRDSLEKKGLFPNLKETYKMRNKIVGKFMEKGYFPSPCGWWSKQGAYQTKGNIPQVSKNKWEQYDSMIAFGPGAYGWLTGESKEVVQTHNDLDIKNYLNTINETDKLPLSFGRKLTGYASIGSRLGFNFKSNQAIDLGKYEKRFGFSFLNDSVIGPVLEELLSKGFLYWERPNVLRPTMKGEALHEEIISLYLHQKIGGIEEKVCKK